MLQEHLVLIAHNICHPELSVDVNDVEGALKLAAKLRDDADFYKKCAIGSHFLYNKHYTEEVWKTKMEKML